MAIQLTERPYEYGFTKNEARYVFIVTNPASAGCAVEIKLFSHDIKTTSAPPEIIRQLKLYPSPDGFIVFYVHDDLRSLLKTDFPSSTNNDLKPAFLQQRYYWIEYRQVTDLLPNNTWILGERTRKRIMMPGGVEVQKYERDNFFANYLFSEKAWLTWLPANRFVALTQRHYLSWLRASDDIVGATVTQPKLYAKIFYTDGTDAEVNFIVPDFHKSFVFHLPAGVGQLALAAVNPAKTIYYYELRVEDSVAGVLANPYRFYIDYNHLYNWFDWTYINSLNGLDSIRVRGDFTREVEREVSGASQLNLIQDINDEIKNSDSIDIGSILTKKWKADVGYLNTPDEQEALVELLCSVDIFQWIDNRWLRVIILNKTQVLAGSDDTIFNYPLEWKYAYANEVFTPDKKVFGNGSNTELYDAMVSACANAINLSAVVGAIENGIVSVTFSYEHSGAAEFFIEEGVAGSGVFKPAQAIPIYSSPCLWTFIADGSDRDWRIRVKCTNEDLSGWVNGPMFSIPTDASACALPTALNVEMGTPANGIIPFTFSWAHATAADFKFEYRELGASSWVESTVSALTTILNFADDGKEYQWRVSALCGVSSFSTPVNGYNFIADSAVTCVFPTNLDVEFVSEIGNEITFRFSWDHPGAIDYLLEYKPISGDVWTQENTALTTIDITFATTGERMRWRVSAICTPGNFSTATIGPPFSLFL